MISKKSIDMIINHEIGGKAYYEKVLQKPTFPGGQSGVTIGLGYDLGYNTDKQFLEDWSDKLNLNFLTPLRKVIGLKGESAKQMLKGEILQVRVPYNAAYEVFIKKKFAKILCYDKSNISSIRNVK